MKIAVITPYYKEPEAWITQCHESVKAQTVADGHQLEHFWVADGHPSDVVAGWGVPHLVLPRAHADWGDTPRGLGAMMAVSQGFDIIAFLDADNWWETSHLGMVLSAMKQNAAIVGSASRTIVDLEGKFLLHDRESNGITHTDTSCLVLARPAFGILPIWSMKPKNLAAVGDRVIWQAIVNRQYRRVHIADYTVNFRSHYAVHYQKVGRSQPQGARTFEGISTVSADWWKQQSNEYRQAWSDFFVHGKWPDSRFL